MDMQSALKEARGESQAKSRMSSLWRPASVLRRARPDSRSFAARGSSSTFAPAALAASRQDGRSNTNAPV